MATSFSNDSGGGGGATAQNSGESCNDGQIPKRRGPKPDSKPALTRRQELNRQAQRTHRERKEYYVKALEQEVLRLRECVNEISHENNRITEENIKLKELLRQHDIPFSETENRHRPDDSYHIGQTDGGGGGSNPIINTSITNPHEPMPPHDNMNLNPQGNDNTSSRQGGGTKLDYDQIGIDFVLTLEFPCLDHMPAMLDWSQHPDNNPNNTTDNEESLYGHTLLATTLPLAQTRSSQQQQQQQQQQAPPTTIQPNPATTFQTPDLRTLLSLSQSLNLNGEVTPVMAWCRILAHPQVNTFTLSDFEWLKRELSGKVGCYGFGAVLEEFEVRDALEEVIRRKGGVFEEGI